MSNDDIYTISDVLSDAIRNSIMSAPDETFTAIKRGLDEWEADRSNVELGANVKLTMRNCIKIRQELKT